MLLWLTEVLSQYFSALTVFQYLTLRGILGTLTALLISLIIGPVMIRKLSQYQIGQAVRDDGPQTHLSKAGTPTMGGALILVAIGISTLLWGHIPPSAHHSTGFGNTQLVIGESSNTKIRNPTAPISMDKYIMRFNIPMYDTF